VEEPVAWVSVLSGCHIRELEAIPVGCRIHDSGRKQEQIQREYLNGLKYSVLDNLKLAFREPCCSELLVSVPESNDP